MTTEHPKLNLERSEAAMAAALKVIPGGVNSPVRAFKAVGGTPPFIATAKGSRITDIDGNNYIDYVGSWGPLILGHAHPNVVAEVARVAAMGLSFGAPTTAETRLAERICQAMPSIERLRLVNSGTEATMSAIRLARAATGRDLVIKFAGCYHGHVDSLLALAGSGALTLGRPSSPGVPANVTANTLVARYNDIEALEGVCRQRGSEIAAIIVEPVAGNMGVVPPQPGFLQGLRQLCDSCGAILIFDEVMTGFRVAWGGAQSLYDVRPDLTTLGKIVGGGMPVGAYGGRAELMSQVSPEGPVYQAGTLSGNPLSVACGLATLEVLSAPGSYQELEKRSARLAAGLAAAFARGGLDVYSTRVGSMLCSFFSQLPVVDNDSAGLCDTGLYGRFFHGMLSRGIYLAPSQFEAMFVSLAHSDQDIDKTIEAAEATVAELQEEQ